MTETSCRENISKKLSAYFNNIIYIDDKFDLNYSENDKDMDKDDENADAPNSEEYDPTSDGDAGEEELHPENQDSDIPNDDVDGVTRLLNYCKEKQLNIFPYKYDKSFQLESFKLFAQKFKFLLLDWKLNPHEHDLTVKIIDSYKSDLELQFIVIYTNEDDLDGIQKNLEVFFGGDLNVLDASKYLFKLQNTYIKISSKYKLPSETIDEFSLMLIDNYGYLFVAFFDLVQKLKQQTGKVLKDFMHPFEFLLTLQITASDDLSEEFFSRELKSIILNQISSSVDIDTEVVNGILHNFNNQINVLKKGDFENIKDGIKGFMLKNEDLEKHYPEIDKKLSKETFHELLDYSAEFNKSSFLIPSKKDEHIKILSDRTGMKKEEIKMLINHFETILLGATFGSDNRLDMTMSLMLKLMKLISYSDPDQFNILLNRIKENDFNNEETTKQLLLNKFSTGDILISQSNEEFLLCISSPCDIFRPHKIEYKIKYLVGYRDKPDKRDYDDIEIHKNHHTIIPINNKIVSVNWNFYGEKVIDLKEKKDVEYLMNFNRPYRLQEQFIKQIVSKYVAFNVRLGVDEVFFKSKGSLMHDTLCKVFSIYPVKKLG